MNKSFKIGDKVVCINPTLTLQKGNQYIIIYVYGDEKNVDVADDKGNRHFNFKSTRFQHVNFMTTDDEIALAKSLIGKTVQSKDNGRPFTVEKWKVVVRGDLSSASVEEYAAEHGFCVAVTGQGSTIPVTKAIVIKRTNLNDGQTAKVYPDKIEINNQVFTKEDIKKLWEAIQ